ncbi:MAG TPA: beta-galactosidase [Verrucomicrobiae bacterium]|nr:beta-galactosidase [Verrucomicrobiae bacterium]
MLKFLSGRFAPFICAGVFIATLAISSSAENTSRHTFAIGTNDFLIDGQRFQIRCGEIHAARVPKEYWRNRLQMAKAMGLNTVCAYLFWNQIEPEPGKFDWSGQADIAEFCKIAQQEGLWVILRPGPYACAEWDEGGLPWWLLKYDDIKLRSRDPRFLDAAKEYLRAVGKKLAPLQITHGGPILMVQVENEYGFFGKDLDYLGDLRQTLIDSGFDVPLFCCDPPNHLKDGWRPDLFPVVNFGSDPAGAFKSLREILPQGPLMCGEFYPGWFDTWGAPHHLGNEPRYLGDLEYMLSHDESFSIYMAHGGTTFGLWSGADRPFKPDTSSYDYDAPISEAGWPTEKFFKTRALLGKYLLPGETLPPVPATNAAISVAPVEATQIAPVFANLPKPVSDTTPKTMEKYDQGHGCILYRTTIPAGPAATLEAAAVHDFGFVFLNGERVGVMDRRSGNFKVPLPARTNSATLDILVEAMGHVNFGHEVFDQKGIHAPVKLGGRELTGWNIFNLPLNDKMLSHLKFRGSGRESAPLDQRRLTSAVTKNGPAFYRATIQIKNPGDTFLDMRPWGKGVAWVNGHCLGRFWDIGPTMTMYVPGPWLKRGKNEIVIFDLLGPEKPVIAALDHPILDELHPEKDFAQTKRPAVTLKLNTPAIESQFAPGTQTQDVKFGSLAQGRYFCLETLSAFDGKPFAAVAELDLLDADGKPLSHENWRIAYVDSEEHKKEDGSAGNAIDGQTANCWQTEWSAAQPPQPHRLVIDLGKSETLSGFRYVPRQGAADLPGRIKDYRVYVGDDLIQK